MNKTKNAILLIISFVSFAMVSVSLFVMFFVEPDSNSEPSVIKLACGAAFWLFLIVGIILQVVVSVNIKRWCRRRSYRSRLKKSRIGLLKVFSNIPAVISDIFLFASLIAFITFMVVNSASIFAYISLSVLFLSFSAHCIFNGKNYYCITNYEYIKAQITKTEESQ